MAVNRRVWEIQPQFLTFASAQREFKALAKRYGVTAEDLCRRDNRDATCRIRNTVVYELRQKFSLSFPVIGDLVKRDHSTVIHAIRRYKEGVRV